MKTARSLIGTQRGFSMVELMVVMVILGVVSVGLFQVLNASRGTYEQQKVTLEMQQNARAALEKLADDFRHVSYGKDPTQPSIEYACGDSITFVADVEPDVPGAEFITYALSSDGDLDTPNPNDTILMKTVADSGGVVLYAEAQSYGIKTNGGLSFRYFNGAGVEMPNNPVPQPETVGEVMIEVVAVEPRVHKRTGTYQEQTLSTTIYPRNLPLTPARSRPSTPVVGPLSLPDCQSVTVPWQTPTTNTDGTTLELADISHFTVYFGTHIDSMSLSSRLARTINQWTVTDLIGGFTYYLGVTCTSRSGVESHMGVDNINLSSPLAPAQVQGLTAIPNAYGNGIRLEWSTVTEFTGGEIITTPVLYHIYRDDSPGFALDPGLRLGSQEAQTWFVDSTMADCTTYYYSVSASACGNEGAGADELARSTPARPDCVAGINAYPTENNGELYVEWYPPTSRIDGSALSPEDITAYRIYYNTEPYLTDTYVDYPASGADFYISGLPTCTTFYINVAAFDQCPQLGDLCAYNQIEVDTAEPCDPEPPATVPLVRVVAADERVDVSWPANTIDCDLFGYRVYYGNLAGGPYNGVDAAEGPSPLTFTTPQVIDGDSCRVSLTGMEPCQNYSVVVSAIDTCNPYNEGGASPEVTRTTECMACDIEAGCAGVIDAPDNDGDIQLELFTISGAGETVRSIVPQWSGGAWVRQVYAGRPLVCVWKSDGACGEDGDIGDQMSGAELNVDDFDLPSSAAQHDGLPLALFFDSDMVGQVLTLDLRGASGGFCSTEPRTVQNAYAFDNYDDGDISNWTVNGGDWQVVEGELYQASSANTCFLLHPGSFGDFTIETKVKCVLGQTPYLVFRADLGSGCYYTLGLQTTRNRIRFRRWWNGRASDRATASVSLSNNTWYHLKVEATGNTLKAYLDCELLFTYTDSSRLLPSGAVGYRTYQSKVYFDDFRVYAPSDLF